MSKRNVPVILATNIKIIWIAKMRGIAIGGVQHLEHHLAFSKLNAAKVSILLHQPRLPGNRTFIPERLFDRGDEETRILPQQLDLIRVGQKGVNCVSDQ